VAKHYPSHWILEVHRDRSTSKAKPTDKNAQRQREDEILKRMLNPHPRIS